ncbi:hypothetical protein ENUP19_0248G0064 [Entamoeba nuttalli]|uniref:Uncharacterized protein n=1 Tax=Entamoeba nuttalli TaxID=412467 RepID=A0ABQ0DR14_9EUKA
MFIILIGIFELPFVNIGIANIGVVILLIVLYSFWFIAWVLHENVANEGVEQPQRRDQHQYNLYERILRYTFLILKFIIKVIAKCTIKIFIEPLLIILIQTIRRELN